MTDRRIQVAIVGCGGIAFGKHLPALAKLEGVEVAAFCDVVETNARKAAAEFGTADARVVTDYRDVMAMDNIDAVYVLTANFLHATVSIAALHAGKHVMCEKPMAMNSEEAASMLQAAHETGKILTVGYQNRFRKDSRYLKAACEAGDLGHIYAAKAIAVRRRMVPTWGNFLSRELQGGGPLIDVGTHALDLTLWMMDNYEPKTVLGVTYDYLGTQGSSANQWGPWDPEKYSVEDAAFALITFQNGASVVLESSWALNTLMTGEARTILHGTKAGADMVDGLRINGEKHGRLYTETPDLNVPSALLGSAVSEQAADVEAAHFIDCIRNETQPIVKPEQALVVTKILEAVYESASKGEPVPL
ncbi:Gfo/Idh/MocA family protein [Alicyclobacillus sp. SO9]|uniref:Gfo/Idh/MocA family protein n=1 Tax=Alicyclobacillus sp. SO9 TaxID=2665646 RepID=UPI0018E89028|nr:Gfo/Idh/MocA family oxidoreductase [Alicyclobacillus sp. SO9]QQE77554.1 Gfo/Idh/MocA family oxidoreductase [Alicyclobacillus sp. SO9]